MMLVDMISVYNFDAVSYIGLPCTLFQGRSRVLFSLYIIYALITSHCYVVIVKLGFSCTFFEYTLITRYCFAFRF